MGLYLTACNADGVFVKHTVSWNLAACNLADTDVQNEHLPHPEGRWSPVDSSETSIAVYQIPLRHI